MEQDSLELSLRDIWTANARKLNPVRYLSPFFPPPSFRGFRFVSSRLGQTEDRANPRVEIQKASAKVCPAFNNLDQARTSSPVETPDKTTGIFARGTRVGCARVFSG